MEILYVETKRKFQESEINLELLKKLPGKTISLAATVQYIDLIPKVRSYLELLKKKVVVKQGAYYEGQVLGCNSSALDERADTILIITDGKFHAINNATQIQRPIYIFTTRALEKIEQKEIEDHNKKTLAKQKKFLNAETVGILLSTKYGQHQKNISKIKKEIKSLGKRVYIFETDNIAIGELENFPQIQIWINTACPGLARDDNKIINLSDIKL